MLSLCVLAGGCNKETKQEKASYISMGMECIESSDYEEALNNFEAAAAAKEDEQLVSRGRGIAYIGLGEYETAIENLKLVLKKSSGKITSLELDTAYYLALAQYKNSDREGAIGTYSNILSFDGKDSRAYYLRGVVYLADGDLEKSKADFDNAVKNDENNYELYADIYKNLNDKGYETEGIEYLNKALALKDSKDNGLNKGMIYYYLGDTTNALTELSKAKAAGDIKANLYLGKVYELTGDIQSAVSLYEEYLASGEKVSVTVTENNSQAEESISTQKDTADSDEEDADSSDKTAEDDKQAEGEANGTDETADNKDEAADKNETDSKDKEEDSKDKTADEADKDSKDKSADDADTDSKDKVEDDKDSNDKDAGNNASDSSKSDKEETDNKTGNTGTDKNSTTTLMVSSVDDAGSVYNTIGLCRMEEGNYDEAISNFALGIAVNEGETVQELMFNEAVAYEYKGDFKTAKQKMKNYIAKYPNDNKAAREYEFLKSR